MYIIIRMTKLSSSRSEPSQHCVVQPLFKLSVDSAIITIFIPQTTPPLTI